MIWLLKQKLKLVIFLILPFLHMGTQQLDMFDVMAFTSLVLTVVNGQALVSSLLQGHH